MKLNEKKKKTTLQKVIKTGSIFHRKLTDNPITVHTSKSWVDSGSSPTGALSLDTGAESEAELKILNLGKLFTVRLVASDLRLLGTRSLRDNGKGMVVLGKHPATAVPGPARVILPICKERRRGGGKEGERKEMTSSGLPGPLVAPPRGSDDGGEETRNRCSILSQGLSNTDEKNFPDGPSPTFQGGLVWASRDAPCAKPTLEQVSFFAKLIYIILIIKI